MNDFWDWMEKKTGFNQLIWMNHNRENLKLNLIGHMIEYLMENKVNIGRAVPWHLQGVMSIDGVCNWLKSAIENLKDKINDM